MQLEKIIYNQTAIVFISDKSAVITDISSVLDVIMVIKYEYHTNCVAIAKTAIKESFFQLSTGFAGEVLQKFINYHVKVAIYGDFSSYTSKPLKDFIRESNQGSSIFFVPTKEEAVKALLKHI